MQVKSWLLLGLLSLLWGGSFFFVGIAVKEFSPLLLVSLRVILACGFLWLFTLLARREIGVWGKDAIIGVVVMGIFNNVVPFLLLTWGQSHIPSGLAAILNACTSFVTMIMAHFFTKDDKLRPGKVVGILLAFIGVIAIFSPRINREINFAGEILPMLACLLATVSYGISGIWGRSLPRRGVKPYHSALGMLTASSLMMAAPGWVSWQNLPTSPGLGAWLAIAGLAIGSTALAYLVFFHLLATVGASYTALVTVMVPVTALILGSLFLRESLHLLDYAGLGLIILGLATVDGRLVAKLTGKAQT